ncbi:MAG: hypothetical protein WB709_14150 [Solirubrobacteraceae bacterium]
MAQNSPSLGQVYNRVDFVKASVAVAERKERLLALGVKSMDGPLSRDECRIIQQLLRQGHKEAVAAIKEVAGGTMLIRLWVAGNLLGLVTTLIRLGNLGRGTLPAGLQSFYITAGAIFPVLAIAGFVEMTQSAYFARSGNIARILGFSIPIVSGEAVCLTALAQETSHEWMTRSTVMALVLTFGFQVSLLVLRAVFAYTQATDLSEKIISGRLKRTTTEWEAMKARPPLSVIDASGALLVYADGIPPVTPDSRADRARDL